MSISSMMFAQCLLVFVVILDNYKAFISIEAFQIPQQQVNNRHNGIVQSYKSFQRNELIRSTTPMVRLRQTLHNQDVSSSSRLNYTGNNNIQDDENFDDTDDIDIIAASYMSLLQTFMDDYADDARQELQTFNHQASSSSSAGSATATAALVHYTHNNHAMESPLSSAQSTTQPQRHPQESPALTMSSSSSSDNESKQDDDDDIWRARLLLVGAAALYGTNFSLVKILGDTMPVGISTTLRFGLAALATAPWLLNGELFKSKNAQRAALLGLEVGFWNSIGYVAQAVGLETTLASKSAFICSMAVVIVPLLDYMTGKRLLTRQWIGALMALVGVAFLELGGGDGINDALSSLSTGDALSLVQPFMFGIGFWRMEKAMHQFPQEAQRMTAGQLMAVFLSSAAYGLWSVNNAVGDGAGALSFSTISTWYPWKEWLTDPMILFSLFWTGCITTALTIYMETMALETLSAAETTLIFSTEPLWGTAFASVVMGEQLGMNAGVGAFFILTACLYSNLGKQGLEGLRTKTSNWMNQSLRLKNNNGNDKNQKNISSFMKSIRDKWSGTAAGLASSLATWNLANGAEIKPFELDQIVDELMDKLS